jgi:hypothetical protein
MISGNQKEKISGCDKKLMLVLFAASSLVQSYVSRELDSSGTYGSWAGPVTGPEDSYRVGCVCVFAEPQRAGLDPLGLSSDENVYISIQLIYQLNSSDFNEIFGKENCVFLHWFLVFI